jgi:hypothetical protein
MARVGRIAGAILAETGGRYFLVGNTKMPCDWAAAGFEPPVEIDALKRPYLALVRIGSVDIGPHLTLELEGEDLARRLSECFVIRRTGSVSERLWRLVVGGDEEDDAPAAQTIEARWLGEMPVRVWQVVQDTVLRCV